MLDNIFNFFVRGNLYSLVLMIPVFMSMLATDQWKKRKQNQVGGVSSRAKKNRRILVIFSFGFQGILCFLVSLLVKWQLISPNGLVYQSSFLFLSIVSLIYIIFLWVDLSD